MAVRPRGVTLIEIFVALAALAIVLAVASTPLQRISARADVDIARDSIVGALETARSSARRANTPVRVYLSENASDNRLVAGFSPHRGAIDFYPMPNYVLPQHVTVALTGGLSVIEYLAAGAASGRGMIRLSSTYDPDYVVAIHVENGLILPEPGSPRARHVNR